MLWVNSSRYAGGWTGQTLIMAVSISMELDTMVCYEILSYQNIQINFDSYTVELIEYNDASDAVLVPILVKPYLQKRHTSARKSFAHARSTRQRFLLIFNGAPWRTSPLFASVCKKKHASDKPAYWSVVFLFSTNTWLKSIKSMRYFRHSIRFWRLRHCNTSTGPTHLCRWSLLVALLQPYTAHMLMQ